MANKIMGRKIFFSPMGDEAWRVDVGVNENLPSVEELF